LDTSPRRSFDGRSRRRRCAARARWLETEPDKDNSALSKYAAFKTFAGLKLAQSEQGRAR
jgi:hypothetical protein